MSALIYARPARVSRPRPPLPLRLAALAALCLALLAAGCAARPKITPASAQSQARPVSYVPVLSGYVPQRPADPKAWRERNESVTPQEKGQ
jgi:hypothetical protein